MPQFNPDKVARLVSELRKALERLAVLEPDGRLSGVG
jgi:predicted component of type VI protein secretion system